MRLIPSKKTRIIALVGLLAGVLVYKFAASAGPSNGFDLSNSILPREQILHGGPPRDGICMRQPWPAPSEPPMTASSSGTTTSVPVVGQL